MASVITLGPVGFKPTGAYDNTREYKKLDVVIYQGSSYVAISDSLGQLPTNTTYWNCIAEKGSKGDPGTVKFEVVQTLPITDIEEGTIYLVPYAEITIQELPSTGNADTIYKVESTNKTYIYENNQWIEITNDNRYIEYLYVNNTWERLGAIGVTPTLTNYYTKTETDTLLSGKVDNSALNNYYTKTRTDELLAEKEVLTNKVTSISSSSTDLQYPSAKCVYEIVGNIATALDTIQGEVI